MSYDVGWFVRRTLQHLPMPSPSTIVEPEPWMDSAVCATTDPELWFPLKGGDSAAAKDICGGCAVRSDCLAYALENDERWGVWGGLTETERRKLRRAS